MAPRTPIWLACNTALKALLTALAKFNNIFLIFKSRKYFPVPILTFLRHLIQLTAPCCETFFFLASQKPLYFCCFPRQLLLMSPSPDSPILLSPKTWYCSESALGLLLLLWDNQLLSLSMTVTRLTH